jgi:glutaredoxin
LEILIALGSVAGQVDNSDVDASAGVVSCQGVAVTSSKRSIAWLLALVASLITAWVPAIAMAGTTIEFYTRPGCPHCVEARRFLDEETLRRADITIVVHDVTRDRLALDRLRELADRSGISTPGVPAFAVGDRLLVGFDPDTTPGRLRALIAGAGDAAQDSAACGAESTPCEARPDDSPDDAIALPLVGQVSADALGLPLFTVAVGLIDGFNPCATWVLLFLLAMLVNLQNRSRMALIAGTFVLVSGLVYFAFMAAWLTFFMVIGISQPVRFVLAAFAVLAGAVNIKDFFALGHGPSLSIPDSAKPGLYARMRAILRAERLGRAMIGIVVLAFLVNLIELLCTAGLPALYTAILTSRGLPTWEYYAYLALYIAAYMLDDAILVTIGVVTLGKRKLQERGGRWLKLISGLVMLGLGVALLFFPALLGF